MKIISYQEHKETNLKSFQSRPSSSCQRFRIFWRKKSLLTRKLGRSRSEAIQPSHLWAQHPSPLIQGCSLFPILLSLPRAITKEKRACAFKTLQFLSLQCIQGISVHWRKAFSMESPWKPEKQRIRRTCSIAAKFCLPHPFLLLTWSSVRNCTKHWFHWPVCRHCRGLCSCTVQTYGEQPLIFLLTSLFYRRGYWQCMLLWPLCKIYIVTVPF